MGEEFVTFLGVLSSFIYFLTLVLILEKFKVEDLRLKFREEILTVAILTLAVSLIVTKF